ncbi:MAG: hypothetical protein RKO66_06490 [Candidatus Contendobacter sp.]|nr:hypothetical protein [Candidatus Contendobacter sp.]MDS4058802.1 hypothetical protein [Candidatus Contendobacter sp.]
MRSPFTVARYGRKRFIVSTVVAVAGVRAGAMGGHSGGQESEAALIRSAIKIYIGYFIAARIVIPILNRFSSFPRMRESRQPLKNWIPAFAGMTNSVVLDLKKIKPIGKRYKKWDFGKIDNSRQGCHLSFTLFFDELLIALEFHFQRAH